MIQALRMPRLCPGLFISGLVLMICSSMSPLQAQITTRVAGRSFQPGYNGDGYPSVLAKVNSPWGLTTDIAGNLYIADTQNNRIRKVTPGGIISTVAGKGQRGKSEEGIPATSTQIGFSSGVAVDKLGNLYIADNSNGRILKVDTQGILTSVAGGGTRQEEDIPAKEFSFTPWDVAVDQEGNLYVSDNARFKVYKITPQGIISTLTDALKHGANESYDLTVDNDGNVFVADFNGSRVQKITPAGQVQTVANVNRPSGVAVDPSGNLYVSETFTGIVYKVDAHSTITRFLGGNPKSTTRCEACSPDEEHLQTVRSIALDAQGNLFVSALGDGVILKVSSEASAIPGFLLIEGIGSSIITHQIAVPNRTPPKDVLLLPQLENPSVQVLLSKANAPDSTPVDFLLSHYVDGKPVLVTTLPSTLFSGSPPVKYQIDLSGVISNGPLDTWALQASATIRGQQVLSAPVSFRISSDKVVPGHLGDLNFDNQLDLKDALLSLQGAIGLFAPSSAQQFVSDVSGDGLWDLKDTLLELQAAVGFNEYGRPPF